MTGSGFFWILLACALYGLLHSLLAATRTKTLAAQAAGRSTYQRFYRLFFSVVAGVTALPLLVLPALLPDQRIYAIPAPWVYLTLAIQALAALALLAGILQTGAMRFIGLAQLFEALPGEPAPEKLVTGGLYRWVRHPLYTASLLVIWLVPVMTWNLLALAIGLSAYMLIGTLFEERKLVRQFGQDYIEYRKYTPRIIPGIKLT